MIRDIFLSTGKSGQGRQDGEINIRNGEEIQQLREAAAIIRDLFIQLKRVIKPGVNELDISVFCENYILIRNADPVLKSSGFSSNAVLVSTNNRAYHSQPEDRVLKEGDIVSVDVVLCKNGWFGDGAWTFEVGNCSAYAHRLVDFSRKIVYECVHELNRSRDFSSAGSLVSRRCVEEGFHVVREGAGHGIGKELHEAPLIGFSGESAREPIREGMIFTIEPVITDYPHELSYEDDGAAFVPPGYLASQFEHMVVAGPEGLEILTDPLTLFK